MNKVILMGRATKDAETAYTTNQMAVSKFSLAVDRRKSSNNENPGADFINITAFGKLGEFCEKYVKKGVKFVVVGRINTGSYTNKDGVKVYTTDVIADEMEFAESKSNNNAGFAGINAPVEVEGDGFMNVPAGIDEELPFASAR